MAMLNMDDDERQFPWAWVCGACWEILVAFRGEGFDDGGDLWNC